MQGSELKAYQFQTNFGKSYVEVKAGKVENVNSDIVCCVDRSGSMDGAPMKNVCEVLRNIYRRTKIEYPMISYGTTVKHSTIREVENRNLLCNEGTDFSVIFEAIQERIMKNPTPTTFIFMTDGQHMACRIRLDKTIQKLKLVLSAMKSVPITFHVIGFGAVEHDFLERVRKFGTKEGLLRYSTQSIDLQDN